MGEQSDSECESDESDESDAEESDAIDDEEEEKKQKLIKAKKRKNCDLEPERDLTTEEIDFILEGMGNLSPTKMNKFTNIMQSSYKYQDDVFDILSLDRTTHFNCWNL